MRLHVVSLLFLVREACQEEDQVCSQVKVPQEQEQEADWSHHDAARHQVNVRAVNAVQQQ